MSFTSESTMRVYNSITKHTRTPIHPAEVESLIQTFNKYKYNPGERSSSTILMPDSYSTFRRPIFVTDTGTPYLLMTHCRSDNDTLVGKGSFKTIKMAVHLETGDLAAVAISRELSPEMVKDLKWRRKTLPSLENECKMMQTCADIGAVKFIGSCTRKDPFSQEKHYILMEFCERKSLQENIKTNTLTQEQKCNLALELTKHISNLHAMGLVHCDIKTENIFINADGSCRIGDFGMCKTSTSTQGQGTPMYISPELAPSWHDIVVTKRLSAPLDSNTHLSDAWATGCVLYALFHPQGALFTQTGSRKTTITYIKDLQDEVVAQNLTHLSDECPKPIKEVISGLLKVNPEERMTVEAAHAILSSLEKTEFLIQHPPRQRKRRCC